MKHLKLFGICIMFLLAASAVNAIKENETALNNLLSSYSEDYDNGRFDVALSGLSAESATYHEVFPYDLAWDGAYLWGSSINYDKIYKINRTTGLVVSSFSSPGASPTGLTWDGTYLWNSELNTGQLYKLTTNGTIAANFTIYGDASMGLAWDGTYLWNADWYYAEIYKIDKNTGLIVDSFSSPGTSPRGLAWDGTYLWNADFSTGLIYKINKTTGLVVSFFPSPGASPTGLTWDGVYLLVSDDTGQIYKVTTAGVLAGTYPKPFIATAGKVKVDFNITGLGTGNKYDVIAVLNVNENDENLIKNMTKTGAGISEFVFSGNYYDAPDPSYKNNTLIWDVKIYQNKTLQYQDEFEVIINHMTSPIRFDYGPYPKPAILPINNGGPDQRYDLVNLSLYMSFAESGTYTIGAYLWDNKSATAYAEKTITQLPGSANVTITFNSNQFKDFELNKERMYLKAVSVNGNTIDIDDYLYNMNDAIYFIYNYWNPSPMFNTSLNFTFNDAYITRYAFDTSSKDANGKIKELGVILNAVDVKNPPYTLELSLENEYGEVVEIKNKTTSFTGGIETIKFNGTKIYNSKISGPYRIGFARIAKSGNDVFYKLDAATSMDLAYINFTPPVFADLKINDSDLIGNGNDINVTIYNKAAGDAAGVTVSVFDNSAEKVKEIIIGSIAGNSNYKYTFRDIGLSNAFIVVDFANLIEESNESNNIAALIGLNEPPVITSTAGTTGTVGVAYTYDVNANDADGNTLTYSLTTKPTGMTINSGTGVISWTPSAAGNYNAVVSVSDGINAPVTQSFSIAVSAAANSAPIISSTAITSATVATAYTYDVNANDADGDTLTYSLTTKPTGMIINSANGLILWTPISGQIGANGVTVSVTDSINPAVIQSFTIIVSAAANSPPIITSTPSSTATRGIQYSYTMTATDADLDPLTYSVNDSLFSKAVNVFTWTPDNNQYGQRKVTFNVTDGKSAPVTQQAVISLSEDVYILRAATLDYQEKDAGRYTYINSNITINSRTNNTVGSTPAGFTVNSSTAYSIIHSAAGYQPDTDYVYFDSRLPTCTAGINCNLAGAYTTSCAWEAAPGNWYCSVVGGTLPKMTWFRYARSPYQMIKRVNYLMKS